MRPILVSIQNLTVQLGEKRILHGLSAQLRQGEITALIGLNGSGKTTLLRAILQEIPYRGDIRFHCGHDHSHPAPQHVGYVPQKLRLDADLPLTVCDLLALALQRRPLILGVSRALQKTLVEMLQRVGLEASILHRPVSKISGGELQRVLLALALKPDPELLLLDEPAAGIDFQYQDEFYDLLGQINRQTGVTIVLVSHELSVVTRYAHHVLCLKNGHIMCQGPPSEIVTGEVLAQTFGERKQVYAHSHQEKERG